MSSPVNNKATNDYENMNWSRYQEQYTEVTTYTYKIEIKITQLADVIRDTFPAAAPSVENHSKE